MASYSFLGHTMLTPISIVDESPVFVSDTLNLRRQTVSQGAQRWRFNITFENGLHSSIMADFMAHHRMNQNNSFALPVPQNFDLADNAFQKGASPVNTTASLAVNATVVTLSSTLAFRIPTGWFVKFANHNKVYMVVSGMSTTSTSGSITLSPGLTSAVTAPMELTIEDVMATVRYNTDSSGTFTYSRGVRQKLNQEFIEHLS